MISLLIWALVNIITILGISALLAIVGYIAFITLRYVINKIRKFLSEKFCTKVAIVSVGKVVEEVAREKQRNNEVVALSQLEQTLGDEGVIIAKVDKNGKIENFENDIEIIKTDEMEENLKRQLKNHDGVMVVEDK